MTQDVVCVVLEWDSEFFGRRIGRVKARVLDEAVMGQVQSFARAESIDCLYYLADAGDGESIRAAELAGFRNTDIRVTRERSLERISSELPRGVEKFGEDDLPVLQEISRTSHGATRFYRDPHFSREQCDALYERWITNACEGQAESVLVVRQAGRAAGYLTCEIEDQTTGSIGLVAVAESERGQGLGELLVRGSLSWFASRGCDRVSVVSQARNIAAARLYEGMGFQTTAVEHWYHLWRGTEASA